MAMRAAALIGRWHRGVGNVERLGIAGTVSSTRPSDRMHLPVAAGGKIAVMGDQQQRGAGALAQREQQVDDRSPRWRDPGFRSAHRPAAAPVRGRRRGPGRYAAARRRKAGRADGSGGGSGRRHPAPLGRGRRHSRTPASSSGIATFSSAVMVGIRWNAWNTMPTRSRRSLASASSFSRVISCPSKRNAARCGAFQPGQHHQQAGLARSGRDRRDRPPRPWRCRDRCRAEC